MEVWDGEGDSGFPGQLLIFFRDLFVCLFFCLLSYAATTCRNYLYFLTIHNSSKGLDRTSELQEAALSGPLVLHPLSKSCISHLGGQQDSLPYSDPDNAKHREGTK